MLVQAEVAAPVAHLYDLAGRDEATSVPRRLLVYETIPATGLSQANPNPHEQAHAKTADQSLETPAHPITVY